MRSLAAALALGVAMAMAACGAERVMLSGNHAPGTKSTFVYALEPGEILTVVIGNPFAIDDAAVHAAVVDAMQGQTFGPPARFTTTRSERTRPGYAVVFVFDPATAQARSELCGETGRVGSAPAGSETRILVGFCAGSQLLSSVNGATPAVASPTDPRFRSLVSRAMLELIPPEDQPAGRLR